MGNEVSGPNETPQCQQMIQSHWGLLDRQSLRIRTIRTPRPRYRGITFSAQIPSIASSLTHLQAPVRGGVRRHVGVCVHSEAAGEEPAILHGTVDRHHDGCGIPARRQSADAPYFAATPSSR